MVTLADSTGVGKGPRKRHGRPQDRARQDEEVAEGPNDPGTGNPGTGDDDKEPDARFSYANERTFLAWIRTSLGLVTAGLAITQLLPPFHLAVGGASWIGLPLIALGVVVAPAQL